MVLKAIKALLSRPSGTPSEPVLGDFTPELQLATTALLCEVIRADRRVSGAEKQVAESITRKALGLPLEEVRDLMGEAQTALIDERSFDKFSRLISTSFTLDQKRYLLELLWTCALSDERLERNEDYVVRKVGRALSLNPLDIVDAKQKAEASYVRRRRDS
jgi:uncharacterized tellurite resistance protein B-like protein